MKKYLKRLAVIMMALACALALCACGSTSDAEPEPEAEEPVVKQDAVVGEYELAGVTCEISDDIDSYLTATIDEELSQLFGEEQLYINADNSFERKAGDYKIDSGTWTKGDDNTLTTNGTVTMEFRCNDEGTVLVQSANEEEADMVGRDYDYVYKKK